MKPQVPFQVIHFLLPHLHTCIIHEKMSSLRERSNEREEYFKYAPGISVTYPDIWGSIRNVRSTIVLIKDWNVRGIMMDFCRWFSLLWAPQSLVFPHNTIRQMKILTPFESKHHQSKPKFVSKKDAFIKLIKVKKKNVRKKTLHHFNTQQVKKI